MGYPRPPSYAAPVRAAMLIWAFRLGSPQGGRGFADQRDWQGLLLFHAVKPRLADQKRAGYRWVMVFGYLFFASFFVIGGGGSLFGREVRMRYGLVEVTLKVQMTMSPLLAG